ncbi:hypothetical protein Glove_495g15 [Diversispora epigaea]|uniref:Uncharacterized protein n=1 Tax=Diversispora epigaea TaxID=1348612 RepID=A0A397GHZ0_9GLOM|nr:hypothetical protein Glove_495g15 [Diversispora epigaea]
MLAYNSHILYKESMSKNFDEVYILPCLNQKLTKYNEAKLIFKGLTDLNYKPGHKEYTYYKYWLKSNGHANSIDKNDIALLDAYQLKEIHSQYIIQVAGKGYTVIDYSSEVYRMLNTHECIDGNQPLYLIIDIDTRQKPDPEDPKLLFLDSEKIIRKDLMSRILVACADALYLILGCMPTLNFFALTNSLNTEKCSWHIIYLYVQFINYRELQGFTKKVVEIVGKPYSEFIDTGLPKTHFNLQLLGSVKEVCIKRLTMSSVKNEFQQLEDYLVQLKSDYSSKQYKSDHKDLSFSNVVLNSHSLSELPEEIINVKEIKDTSKTYPDFLSKEFNTTLI